jgi:membrane-associated protein
VVGALVDAIVSLPPWLVLLLVFALPALEASAFVGIVVPGETAVIVGGVVAHGGDLELWMVIAAAILGAAIGDQVGYRVGRRYGPRLVNRMPHRLQSSGQVEKALDFVRRRGPMAVVLGRWVAALRALVPGVAGMSGMHVRPFTTANIAGGALWATAMAVAGYLAGASFRLLEHRLGVAGEILLGVIVLTLIVLAVRHRFRESRAG